MIFQNYLATILLVTLWCLSFDINTCTANPGLSVQVTQKGFDYATQYALNKLQEKMQSSQIPDMEKHGSLYYRLSNIKITAISTPTGHVTLLPGQGLKWQVGLAQLTIIGDWRYKKKVAFFKIRHSGSMRLSLSGTRAEVIILPSKATNGGISVRATSCSCSTSLNIHVSSWFLRLLLRFFRRKIEKKLEEQICKSAISAVNDKVSPKLTQYPLSKTIAHDYVLDYSLESNPVISSTYLQTNHKAMVHYKNDRRAIPFTPDSWPNVYENKKMIYFIISNYVFDTWLFAAHQNNILKKTYSAQNLKEKHREYLRTTCPGSVCIGTIFPQIATTFPRSTLQVSVSTSDRPRMNFLPNRIQLTIPTVLQFNLILPNASLVNTFSVHLNTFAEAHVRLVDTTVFFTVSNMSFVFGNIEGVYAKKYDIGPLQTALKMASYVLIPYLSELGSKGMPILLPKDTAILRPEFRIVKNAIILGSDLSIGPS